MAATTVTVGYEQLLPVRITLLAGATNRYRFRFVAKDTGSDDRQPIDLTGWRAVSQLRTNGVTVLDISPYITLDANGYITVSIPDEATYGLKEQTCDYDLLLEDPAGDVIRVIAGKARVKHVTSEGASHV
ncbi:hypothetical protein [Bifidobacterium tissieri]|uniref:Uncharacterized protein n=1 Tax=Bifidobacterium tissieri TaxID=1630162 RepID=A0A5M9ZVJ5_9BIFI|nr:hypothetical protein [Bifidobacterium tissieri]KAA8829343.1 hypothetical protein EM849_11095 [Bifidobacterium tissieri]KAA8831656.1 hypothetical protein EMO89_02735 [Bifidobacterium tissieri]